MYFHITRYQQKMQ